MRLRRLGLNAGLASRLGGSAPANGPGVAGSKEKAALLVTELGANRAIDRHDGAAIDLLREAVPDGIDLYYDNIGGEQLEAELEALNHGGRAITCGAVAGSHLPRNFATVIHNGLTFRGFTVTAHEDLRGQFESEVRGWIREGRVRSVHTEFEDIDQVPAAFESVLFGSSTGRVLVSIPTPAA